MTERCTTRLMAAALGKRFGDARPVTAATSGCYAGGMAFSREQILESLARLPFIDAGELAIILGGPLATVHRALLSEGLAPAGEPRRPTLALKPPPRHRRNAGKRVQFCGMEEC